jgi:ketosteroid isomerase-like protein
MDRRHLLLPFALSAAAFAQEPSYTTVPLKSCDRLLLAPVEVDGRRYDFLVDTGATTILNAQTFRGNARDVVINSYRGESAMKGANVRVREFRLGTAKANDLNFKAIDLSAIGEACGGRVDGLLGVDMLGKLDATIDVKKKLAKVGLAHDAEYNALVARMTECNNLFNQGDTEHFRAQFATDIVWVGPNFEARGRDAVIQHIQNDFVLKGAKMISYTKPEDFHLDGDTYWVNYLCDVVLPNRTLHYRATMVSRLHGDQWQLQTAHYSPMAP